MRNAFVIVKFKYRGENDAIIRDIIKTEFVPFFGGINGRLDLVDVKNGEVTLGIFQDYPSDVKFENIKKKLGEKVKSVVSFKLTVDEDYIPDTLEVVEVKQ